MSGCHAQPTRRTIPAPRRFSIAAHKAGRRPFSGSGTRSPARGRPAGRPYTGPLRLALLLLIGGIPALAQAPIIHPAGEADPNPGPPGEKPYEMAGRAEERTPLVSFDDVTGWVVEGHNAEGWLYRTDEQRVYADHSAKLVYVARGADPWILVRPEQPIAIPDPWECVNFWNYGNSWGWAPDPTTPFPWVDVVLRDAEGAEARIGLGNITYQYWFVMNGRLPRAQLEGLKHPLQLVGFRFANIGNTDPRTIYLGPCEFFKEQLGPLTFEPWPAKLPFPTRQETILPLNKTKDFANAVRREGETYVLAYRGADCRLQYRYTAATGTLGDVELVHDGQTMHPMARGGIHLAAPNGGTFAPGAPEVSAKLQGVKLEGDSVRAAWHIAAPGVEADVVYRLRIAQKSLIVEIECDQPVIERVDLGRAEGLRAPQLFWMPYLTYGGNDPRALYANGLFLFSQFDWYASDASVLYGAASAGPDWAAYNGGAQYIPKTDGTRNPVRERLFLTASPDFQEVLPTVANPPSPMREAMGDRLWRVKSGADHAAEIAEAKHLRFYGLDKVAVRYHEDSWRDAGESFTFRTQAAPKRGGDEALRKFVAAVQALGWRVGLYTNYTDFAPVNSYWSEDHVSREPDGNWQRAWMRCYAPKPMWSVEMEAKLAPQIHAKFGENHSYCDVHTAVTPFQRVDYDARVPGAGTFRRTFECFGRLLYNEKTAHHGPVYSEGNNHWWYAGLTDGNYAQLVTGQPPKEPLLVDFDLLKLHPLEMDAGMGDPGMFFRGAPRDLDQFIATTLAYGHIGYADWDDLAGTLRIYYMLQSIQPAYAMVPVKKIEYEDGGKMLDTSQALITGAYKRGRVHVVYENGFEVNVNGSPEPWAIDEHGQIVLPQWGYFARDPETGACSFSGLGYLTGSHTDWSQGSDWFYVDSRGRFDYLGGAAVDGAAALRRDGDDWYVIPAPRFRDFGFSPEVAGLNDDRGVDAEPVTESGEPAPAPGIRWSRGLVHLLPAQAEGVKYRLRQAERPAPPMPTCARPFAPAGSSLPVTAPEGVDADAAFWEVDGRRQPCRATASADGELTCTVPADVVAGSHLWLGLPKGDETLWLDFIAVAPVELAFEVPPATTLDPGQKLAAKLRAVSSLEGPVTAHMRFSGPGAVEPAEMELELTPFETREIDLAVSLPWAEGEVPLEATATVNGQPTTVRRVLRAEWSTPSLIDLCDPGLPRTKGFCVRGKAEVEGLSEGTDGSFEPSRGASGGVERACLFSHPPYGAGGVGYVYSACAVDLPDTPVPCLDFWMGMRDGLDATDGVTFRVLAWEEGGTPQELFSRHHKETRWEHAQVDLAAFAGKKVYLKLIADCGPANDTTADHALWGDLSIRATQPQLVVRAE